MNGYSRIATVLFSLSALCGCAHDALLREETQRFVEVGQKSEIAGRAFYDNIVAKDREVWVFMYRVDPDCKPKPFGESYSDQSDNPLNICTRKKHKDTDPPLEAVSRETFGSRYAALAFIDSYLEALAKVSQAPKMDASQNFKVAASDLNLLLDALKQEKVADVKIGAVADLVSMLEQLSKDRESAKAIKKIADDKAQRVDADFKQLIVWLSLDVSAKKAQDSLFNATLSQISDSDKDIGGQARARWLENGFRQVDEARSVQACKQKANADPIPEIGLSERDLCGKTSAGVMLGGWRAHKELLSLIDGRMSKKQKARLLKLQRENFFRILKLYLDITSAF